MLDQNLESLRNLEENLNEYGKSLATLPHVVQWNKRDLPDAMPVEELEKHLNHHAATTFEGIANTGQGVFPTLKSLAAQVLKGILDETAGSRNAAGAGGPSAMPAPPAAMPAAQEAQPSLDIAQPKAEPASYQDSAPVPESLGVQGQDQSHQLGNSQPSSGHAQSPAQAQPQVAAQPAQASSSAGQMMQHQKAAPAPQRRAQAQPGGAVRRAKARQGARRQPAPAPVAAPKSSTGLFVFLAAGVGAAIAYALQQFVL